MRLKKATIGLCAILTVTAATAAWVAFPSLNSTAKSEQPPKLSVVIDQGGRAVIAPVFAGREAGTSKYRWDRPFIAADKTVYARLLWLGAAGWPEVAEYKIPLQVEWSGAIPTPVPTPDPPVPTPTPEPEPAPEPVAPLWGVLWIEESRERTAEQAAVIFSEERKLYFESSKLYWRIEDKDVTDKDGKTPADLKPYIDRAVKAGTPCLFLIDTGGKILFEGKPPATSSALIALVRQYAKGGE